MNELNDYVAAGLRTTGGSRRDSRGDARMFDRVDKPFLLAALLSFIGSVLLWFLVEHDYGLFVGIWVPSILALWVGVRIRLGESRRQ
jgi:hypothetical protein